MSSDETHLTRSVPLTSRPAEVHPINWIPQVIELTLGGTCMYRRHAGEDVTTRICMGSGMLYNQEDFDKKKAKGLYLGLCVCSSAVSNHPYNLANKR